MRRHKWKILILLAVISVAIAHNLKNVDEPGNTTLMCQWTVSDGASGLSLVTEGDPTKMSVEDLVEDGLAFTHEARRLVKCQPASFGLPEPPSSRPKSSGMFVRRSDD